MRETDEFYFFWKHEFGQWTQRKIVDCNGIVYNCCEQYMMYQKALLFNDLETAKKILAEKDPKAQKNLGRQIKNYSEKVWEMHRIPIVTAGNLLKFSQHEDIGGRLLNTNNKILCEASPFDNIWGCGFDSKDDKILDMNNWTGMNLLGQCLMTVRSVIREAVTDPPTETSKERVL